MLRSCRHGNRLRRWLNRLTAFLFLLSALSLPFSAHVRAMERAAFEHAAAHAQAGHDFAGDMHAAGKSHCAGSQADGAKHTPLPDDRSACGSCMLCFIAEAEEIAFEAIAPPAGRVIVLRPDMPLAESARPPLHPPRV